MENTVENIFEEQANAAVETIEEETPSLADAVKEEEAPAEEPIHKEPGYVKKRIDAAVSKAVASVRAEYEAKLQEELAPFKQAKLESDADKLVSDGKFNDREMALTYLKAVGGIPEAPKQEPKEIPNDIKARANELYAQAQTIQKIMGIDVMQEYNNNPEIRQKVNSGEWDFSDVANEMGQNRSRGSSPARSPNGVALGSMSIGSMSEAQFAKLNQMLDNGGKIDMRK